MKVTDDKSIQIKTCRNCGRFPKCEKTLKCWGVNPDDENNEAIRVCALGWRGQADGAEKKRFRMPQDENEGPKYPPKRVL